jgi:PKD domain
MPVRLALTRVARRGYGRPVRVLLLAVAAILVIAAPAEAVPQWLAPVTVGGPSDVNVTGEVAVAPDGTTLVVFTQFVGGFERVRARVRRPGEGFGPILELSPEDRQGSAPSVAVDQAGNFTVAFGVDDPTTQVRAARLPAGAGAFEAIEIVSSGDNALSPVVGVGGKGAAVIAYRQNNAVQAAIRPGAAGDFGPATTVSGSNPTDYDVAVDDSGNAIVVWSRSPAAGTDVVEASERPDGLGFPPPAMARPLSSTTAGHKSTSPSLAMAPDSRVVVLWTFQAGSGPLEVRYIERQPTGTWMGASELASKPGEQARNPDVAIAANGEAVAAWLVDIGGSDVIQAGLRPPGGAFGGYRNFAATTVGVPDVERNRAGDAFVSWGGFMGEGTFAVRRAAGGEFGSVDTIALGTQGTAMPAIALHLENLELDDQGNATAVWGHATNPGGTFVYRLDAASYDAAPPSFSAVAVPPTGAPGSPIGMAATATDRLSSPAITWSFGDGATASGPAVSHAYGAPGAYSVTVTATDSAGNSTSTSRSVLVSAPLAQGPPRITSKVSALWGVNKKRIYLLRMKVLRVPKGGKVELRCKGKKCPYKRMSSKKRRKRAITLFKEIKPRKVVGKKKRSFRAGQRLQLRITAPGYIGKVVKYRLRKGRIPSGQTFCLPLGSSKPRKNC